MENQIISNRKHSVLILFSKIGTKVILGLTETKANIGSEYMQANCIARLNNSMENQFGDLDELESNLLMKSVKYNLKRFARECTYNNSIQYGNGIDMQISMATDDMNLKNILSIILSDQIEGSPYTENKSKIEREIQETVDLILAQLTRISRQYLIYDIIGEIRLTSEFYGIKIKLPKLARQFLHITHNDSDALACAVILNTIKDDVGIDHVFLSTNGQERLEGIKKIDSELDNYDKIYVTDIQLQEEYLPYLKGAINADKLIWVDHHQSKFTESSKWYHLDTSKSACASLLQMYQQLVNNKRNGKIVTKYVKGCNDWDTWEWVKDEEMFGLYVEFMNKAIIQASGDLITGEVSYDTVMQILDETLTLDGPGSISDMSVTGIINDFESVNDMLKEVNKTVEFYLSNYNKIEVEGIPIALIELESNDTMSTSLECQIFLEEIKKIDPLIHVIGIATLNKDKLSMRANTKLINLAEICNMVGGGGHPQAAGCSYTAFKQYYLENIREGSTDIKAFS